MSSRMHFEIPGRFAAGGPDVTWAGSNPFQQGLCLGFDDGTIILSASEFGMTTPPQPISPSRNAVNGVAYDGFRCLAVSTRAEISFIQIDGPHHNWRTVHPGGSHGVVATRSGYFAAPLGAQGLLLLKPADNPEQTMSVTDAAGGLPYFYRTVALHDGNDRETLVFAHRRDGVGLSDFTPGQHRRNIRTFKFDGVDIVDVCGTGPGSLSAVAISRKAELLWIRDTSRRDNPEALSLGGVEGAVIRVLATPRHVFVLSSKALYVWSDLVGMLMGSTRNGPSALPLVIPMEAVDMSLHEDSHLLIVLGSNGFIAPKIKELERQPSDDDSMARRHRFSNEMSRRTNVAELRPQWQNREVEQRMLSSVAV